MGLLDLPPEILQYLITFLSLPSLAVLSATNHQFESLCSLFGFRSHALNLGYSPITSAHSHSNWSWSSKCNYSYQVKDRWKDWNGRGEVLGGLNRCFQKCMPTLRLWKQLNGRGRVVIGRSNVIEIWEVDEKGRSWNSHIEIIYLGKFIKSKRAGMDDITSIATVDDASDDLLISRVSGHISRFRYDSAASTLIETTRYDSITSSPNSTSTVNGLQSLNNLLVSISISRPKLKSVSPNSVHLFPEQKPHSYSIQLHSISSPWLSPTSIAYRTKPWSLLLLNPTTLCVGHTGTKPLSIHTLSESGLLPSTSTRHYSATSIKSSIYSLTSPSSLSTHLRPATTIIAAYYDSVVRVYDTRSNSNNSILELADPWNDDPAYSVTSGGPNGSYIVVGTARNSALRIFDVRNNSKVLVSSSSASNSNTSTFNSSSSITAFAPGKDRSPIYSIGMEFGKIYGVTESRAFGIGFEDVEGWNRGRNNNRLEEEISYYEHSNGGIELRKSNAGRSM